MAIGETDDKETAPQLTPLNGIRFFAVFHIFLFHLWAVRSEMVRAGATSDHRFGGMFAALDTAPWWLRHFLAHGYISTSFFFLLSGFILSYLYWSPGGSSRPRGTASGGPASHASIRRTSSCSRSRCC